MAVAGTVAAIAALGYGIYSGEQGKAAQKRGLRRQDQAQQKAESAAIRQQHKAEMADRAANQKQPDIGSLLTNEQLAQKQGLGATMLTGAGGVDQSKLRLQRSSLLGD